ncbi:MAG: 50S ribosomal protein L29 [Armatimonadetes bacterium]|nr:50S ribosomal protein L29 [Armatimonadota bacterium]MDE2206877.1 50S ribosomal protein L29 [Armatimonadota bacterium]
MRLQLRQVTDDELWLEVSKLRRSLYDLRRKHVMRQLEDVNAIRRTRRQIARALTLLRERELTGTGPA